MDPISKKAKQWIENGKDPRSAHWQAGLEAMLEVFSPYLVPGKLLPVQSLEKDDMTVFTDMLGAADLSPDLTAAFLPPAIAGKIMPPDTAEELFRIDKKKSSYKILISRSGKETRLLCAEISPQAKKPGADIFQDGALLGSYDYDSYEECIKGLTQTIRAHMWQKGQWGMDQYRRYTVNWFEKVMDLKTDTILVNPDFSFLHSPTLIKGTKIDAVFMLISEIMDHRLREPESSLMDAVSGIQRLEDETLRITRLTELAEGVMLECLNVMREFGIVDFAGFSDKENGRFKNAFSRTTMKLLNKLDAGSDAI